MHGWEGRQPGRRSRLKMLNSAARMPTCPASASDTSFVNVLCSVQKGVTFSDVNCRLEQARDSAVGVKQSSSSGARLQSLDQIRTGQAPERHPCHSTGLPSHALEHLTRQMPVTQAWVSEGQAHAAVHGSLVMQRGCTGAGSGYISRMAAASAASSSSPPRSHPSHLQLAAAETAIHSAAWGSQFLIASHLARASRAAAQVAIAGGAGGCGLGRLAELGLLVAAHAGGCAIRIRGAGGLQGFDACGVNTFRLILEGAADVQTSRTAARRLWGIMLSAQASLPGQSEGH